MSAIVLDASVLIKLYVNEEGSRRAVNAVKRADALLTGDRRLVNALAGQPLGKFVRAL